MAVLEHDEWVITEISAVFSFLSDVNGFGAPVVSTNGDELNVVIRHRENYGVLIRYLLGEMPSMEIGYVVNGRAVHKDLDEHIKNKLGKGKVSLLMENRMIRSPNEQGTIQRNEASVIL